MRCESLQLRVQTRQLQLFGLLVWGCTCKEQLFKTCLVDGFEIYNEERIL